MSTEPTTATPATPDAPSKVLTVKKPAAAVKPAVKPASLHPVPVSPTALPAGATFQHTLTWSGFLFFNVRSKASGSKTVGVAVKTPAGAVVFFANGKNTTDGRRNANVYVRAAVNVWAGWSEDPATWVNAKLYAERPFTAVAVSHKK